MTTAIMTVEAVVLVLLALLVAGLLRSHAEILRRLHALGAGLDPDGEAAGEVAIDLRGVASGAAAAGASARAVDVAGSGLRDDAVHVAVAGARHRTLLAFLSSGCLTCRAFWDAFGDRSGLGLPDDVRLVVVTKDAAEESVATLRTLAPAGLPLVMSSAAWTDYAVPGSPYFVLVDGRTGRVRGEGTGARWDQVRNLLEQATADADARADGNEARIDRELLAHGIGPGDPSLYRSADEIAQESRA